MPSTSTLHRLINHWSNARQWSSKQEYIHDSDRNAIESLAKNLIRASSWEQYLESDDWGKENTRIHVNLHPLPFAGSLESAKVVFVLYNPGAGQIDYRDEFNNKQYKNTLTKNIKQEIPLHDIPFFYLDSKFAETGGFHWWEKRLGVLAAYLYSDVSYSEALKKLAADCAVLDLIPYRSTGRADPKLLNLISAELAIDAFENYFLPKASTGEIFLIVKNNVKIHLEKRNIELPNSGTVEVAKSSAGFWIGYPEKNGKIANKLAHYLQSKPSNTCC